MDTGLLRILGSKENCESDEIEGSKELALREEAEAPGWSIDGGEGWEESRLARFNICMGFPIKGFQEEILDMVQRMDAKRKKGKGKGGQVNTKFDRELKKLEWTGMDSKQKKGGGLGRGLWLDQFLS